MLDRETRREKILSALNKEARLKSKAKSKMKMMMDSGVMKKVAGNYQKNITLYFNSILDGRRRR